MSAFIQSSLVTTGRTNIVDPPLVPHQYDDEFEYNSPAEFFKNWRRTGNWDDTNAIALYTAVTSGGVRWSLPGVWTPTLVKRSSWILFQPDTASSPPSGAAQPPSHAYLHKNISLPDDIFVYARMSFTHRNATQSDNESTIGFGLFSGATFTNGVGINLNESDANVIQVQRDLWASGSVTTSSTTNNVGGGTSRGQNIHTVGIQKIGTTYHYWVLAANNWLHMGSVTQASVINTVILYARTSTSAIGNYTQGIDYIRFRPGRTLP